LTSLTPNKLATNIFADSGFG